MSSCIAGRSRGPRGFTIVEMIVVFSVLAIVAVIAAKTYSSVYTKGKIARAETGVNEIDAALQRFKGANGGYYPGLAPWPVNITGASVASYPRDRFFAGPRVIGGSGGFNDDSSKVAQDDYLFDRKAPQSPFVGGSFTTAYPLYLSNITKPTSAMKPVDALVSGGFFEQNQYPPNPFRPGNSMVNIAFMLGEYNRSINNFSLVTLPSVGGYTPRGLTIGRPGPSYGSTNLPANYKYSLYQTSWAQRSLPPGVAMADIYPEGDFAYIPLGPKDPTSALVTDYWLIGYGNLATREASPYNAWLEQNPTLPDFPPPMGDGNVSNLTGFERTIRQLLSGALVVKGSKYTDQLNRTDNLQ
ncbi:MAG: type II secretion system protein [bacterium]